MTLSRRAVVEGLGTALLVATVVGSGIMGERLSAGNTAIALLANTLATAAALVALILTFGPMSGAHFNPAVTLAEAWQERLPWASVPVYLLVQTIGGVSGSCLANVMFGLPAIQLSTHARSGGPQFLSEIVATFGLLAVVEGCVRHRPLSVPYAVAAYIAAAYWFTPSTSFANPAVTLARSLTDTFAGIRPADVPAFVMAQCVGAAAAAHLFRWVGSARA